MSIGNALGMRSFVVYAACGSRFMQLRMALFLKIPFSAVFRFNLIKFGQTTHGHHSNLGEVMAVELRTQSFAICV